MFIVIIFLIIIHCLVFVSHSSSFTGRNTRKYTLKAPENYSVKEIGHPAKGKPHCMILKTVARQFYLKGRSLYHNN